MDRDFIAVLDFGSQYAHLIAKRIRHHGIFTRIFSPSGDIEPLLEAKGIILSGGPESVFGQTAVPFNRAVLELDKPILGLCYGHQLMAHLLGGKVDNLGRGEYGKTPLTLAPGYGGHPLLKAIPPQSEVWMSHGDTVLTPPEGFEVLATTALCPVAVMGHKTRPRFGIQFHPEVVDSVYGNQILKNFADLTGAAHSWTIEAFLAGELERIRSQVAGRNVLMFLSGGVDSTVAFALLTRALGEDKVMGLFINNGFLRLDEQAKIERLYDHLGFHNLKVRDATPAFLKAVEGLTDPQEKRKAVGATFIQARDQFLAELKLDPEQWLLGQGTLYPDIIESGGTQHAEVIKFHHNRVEGIQDLIEAGHVVEPLADLYKDEVRRLGEALELPAAVVWRHPFPGPGLSINVLCAQGDEDYGANPVIEASLAGFLKGSPYQPALLPVRSVGVQGDSRTYTPPAVIMGPQDWDQLEETAIRIINHERRVNRVVTLLAPQALPKLAPKKAFCTRERLDLLRRADDLANRMLEENGLTRKIFQLLVILLPLSENGEGECLVLRPVVSEDVMTARFARLDWYLLNPLAQELLALPGVEAVFYDVTHKPPATFGWE